jgi:hypothetical protein
MAIATESLPTVAAAILAMGLLWVADPDRSRVMRGFGLAFAMASAAHLALFRPPSRWLEAACDVISPVYVAVALIVGVVFTIASLIPAPRMPWQRLLLLAGLALPGLALVMLLYPQCLHGPYGDLDPWLQANWIASIVEARPLVVAIADLPAYAVSVSLPALLATGVVLWRLWRVPDQRAEWAVLLAFLLATALIMLIQIRGARLAIMPAIPAAAWLIVSARRQYLSRPQLPQIAGLVLSWLAFSGVILALLMMAAADLVPGPARQLAEARDGKESCLVPEAFTDLAALPPERVMSPIDLGAHLLLYTPHAVVSAPYHRNQQGVRDTFRFINEPIATARAILDERGIGLVVLCPAMPELAGRADRAEDSFASLYGAGELPEWLVDVSLPGSPLQVFAVLPEQPTGSLQDYSAATPSPIGQETPVPWSPQ